jgi:DNA-directed RNA polymerase specialized sigma24 family protein
MANDSSQEWEDYSHQVGHHLVVLVEGCTGDAALAQGVVADVLGAIRAPVEAGAPVPERELLEVAVLRLAIRRLEERRQQVPVRLWAGAHARTWPGAGPPEDDPELVAAALARLPVRLRIALDLAYIQEYSVEDAADFFELSRGKFLRLLARARRHLLAECERLREGAGAVVGFLAERALRSWRRAQAGLARTQASLDQGLSRLAQLPVLDACSATAGLALVAALTLGAGPPGRETPAAASAASVALAPIVAARPAPGLAGLAVPFAHPASAPAASPSAPEPELASAEEPGSPASLAPVAPLTSVNRVSKEPGPYDKTNYETETRTLVVVDSQEVAPVPEEPSGTLPDQVGVGVDAYVGYHCPPPGERPPPQELACPVLEP